MKPGVGVRAAALFAVAACGQSAVPPDAPVVAHPIDLPVVEPQVAAAAPPRVVNRAPTASFSPNDGATAFSTECAAELRFSMDGLESMGAERAQHAQVVPFEIRRDALGTTLRVGASVAPFFEIDGFSSDIKETWPIELEGASFEIAPTRVVKRLGSRQSVGGRLASDVLGLIGPFTEIAGLLPKGEAVIGAMDPALANLFVAQFVALSAHGARAGGGKANLLSVREYNGNTLARVEFSAPLVWAQPDALPSDLTGEALIGMDGAVHSVSARALNRPKATRGVGNFEVSVHVQCRPSGLETP